MKVLSPAFKIAFLLLAVLPASFLLAACGTFSMSTPTPLPTVVLGSPSGGSGGTPGAGTASPSASGRPSAVGGVTASGVVAPAEQAEMAFTISGNVTAVNVAEGDPVKTGQTLVVLGGQESLQAAVSAAQYELDQAQQALADLNTQSDTDRVQAMQDVVTYQQAVKDAQYALDNFTVPTNQASLDAVEGIIVMKQFLDQARIAFEPVKDRASGDTLRKDRKEALDNAQSDYNAAVRRLQYEYDLQVAETRLSHAQHNYEVLKNGPDPDKERLAQARVANDQTQLAAAQAALQSLTITAPFDGVVSRLDIHTGEWVIPGQSVLVLADLARLHVETTDLSERDVPYVSVGQKVTVFVKALNQDAAGHVTEIAPLADTLGGDVVYKTTIALDSLPSGLRAGMSVDVTFGGNP